MSDIISLAFRFGAILFHGLAEILYISKGIPEDIRLSKKLF